MKNLAELHTEHLEIESEISFLKKEIEFLLKILRNSYSVSVNGAKIKLLDAYWQSFEDLTQKLNILSSQIKKEEKDLALVYQHNLIDTEKTFFQEDSIPSEFYSIYKEIKVLKESFYAYMIGCNECCLKK